MRSVDLLTHKLGNSKKLEMKLTRDEEAYRLPVHAGVRRRGHVSAAAASACSCLRLCCSLHMSTSTSTRTSTSTGCTSTAMISLSLDAVQYNKLDVH
jgi:hypothetical protein